MAYIYNAISKRYFKDDLEITQEEYTVGIANVKAAFEYALKKHNGENVEVPSDLAVLVEAQLSALAANIPDDEITETEALEILLGGAV